MQPGEAQRGGMWLGALLTLLLLLLLCSRIQGQESFSTINHIWMESLPDWTVPNGQNLTLTCIVDISTTSPAQPQRTVLFYKDDVMIRNVSSTRNMESVFIPQARVYDSGTYKCTVILNNKKKTTEDYVVTVKGVPSPRVMLDQKEAIEGGVVAVTCVVMEERGPIHFTIEKLELDTKIVKQKKEKTSRDDNFVTLNFPIEEQDHVLVFRCQARIRFGIHIEMSESTRSDLLTVRESFSVPKFHVSPPGLITEGAELIIRCTIQVTHLAQEFLELIIQKDKEIVTSRRGNEAVYTVTALAEHSGNYTCKVESSRLSKVSSIVVNITELFAKPKLESSSIRLDQGERLDLWCHIPEGPPANFTIQKEDMIVAYKGEFTKITSKWDSGLYTCTARIGKVVKKSNPVQVTVCEKLSKPRISHSAKAELIKGQTIRISCQSMNGSSPIAYRLLKATNVLDMTKKLSNDPVVFQDTPTNDVEYQCLADNCHSHPEVASEVLRVKVVAPVDEVKLSRLLKDEAESGEEIILRCSVNEGTGPITYKFFRGQEDRPFHQSTLNDTQAFWRHEQASKEQEGQYYCMASNRASLARGSRSNTLTVRVFLAPWKKGLIAVVVIGVVIAALIVAARCYFLKKAKAKQMPVEMSRPAVPLLNSNKKASDSNVEASGHYGDFDDVGNHAMKPLNEKNDSLNSAVEYTEVQVSAVEPHQAALGMKSPETVYSEIRKTDPKNGRLP